MTVITWYFEQGAWWPSERGRSSPASSCWQMVVSLTRGYSVDQTPSWNKEELKKRSESIWKISILQCIQKTVGNITLMWSISYIYSALLNCLMSRLYWFYVSLSVTGVAQIDGVCWAVPYTRRSSESGLCSHWRGCRHGSSNIFCRNLMIS